MNNNINKNKVLDQFDSYANSKKSTSLYIRFSFIFCIVVVVASLFFAFSVSNAAYNKIQVIDAQGQYLPTRIEEQKKLFLEFIKSHCSQTAYYINSFDRLSLKENQTRALFLVDKASAMRLFSKYKDDKAYFDAIDRGFVYKTTFIKLKTIGDTSQEPIPVTFISELVIYSGDQEKKFIIESEGSLIRTTPQFPENTTGFYFTSYNQTFINDYEQD